MASKKKLTKNRKARLEEKARKEKQRKRNMIIIAIASAVALIAIIVGIVLAVNYEAPAPQYYAEIQVKDVGIIKVELNSEKSPKAVGKFIELANKGTYNGVSFYEIANGKLYAGSKDASVAQILGEFDNGLTNEKGVISMAKSSVNTVNPALFYINLQDNAQNDKEAVEFGKVISGLDLLEKLTVTEENSPIIEKITIIEK